MDNSLYIQILEQTERRDEYNQLMCIHKSDGYTNSSIDTVDDIVGALVEHESDLIKIRSKIGYKAELIDYIGMLIYNARSRGSIRTFGSRPVSVFPVGWNIEDLRDGRISREEFVTKSKLHLLQHGLYNLSTLIHKDTLWDTELMYDENLRIPTLVSTKVRHVAIHINLDSTISMVVKDLFTIGELACVSATNILEVPRLKKILDTITYAGWCDIYSLWHAKVKGKYKAIVATADGERHFAIWEK